MSHRARGRETCPPDTQLPDLTSHLSAEDSALVSPLSLCAHLPAQVKADDQVRLERDPFSRFVYLAKYVGVDQSHFEILSKYEALLRGMVADLMEVADEKLMSSGVTANACLSASGVDAASRRETWAAYLQSLLSWQVENIEELGDAMDMMSSMRENYPSIGYEHLGGMLAFLSCEATRLICEAPSVALCEKASLINAVNRLFWLQNVSLTRGYLQGKSR